MAGNEVSSESKLSPTPESEKEHGDDAGTLFPKAETPSQDMEL
jgi:hypothetical protein